MPMRGEERLMSAMSAKGARKNKNNQKPGNATNMATALGFFLSLLSSISITSLICQQACGFTRPMDKGCFANLKISPPALRNADTINNCA